MGGSRVKPVAPEHWQVVLVQKGAPLVLRVTVRDRFGVPIPNMTVSMTQNAAPLAGPDKQALKTDANGRVDVAGFDGGTLTFIADPTYVPPDTTDTRNGQPQRCAYTMTRMTLPKTCELVPADDGSTSGKTYFLDTTNAYVTVFCDVNPWVPQHRFPWQNPVHLSGEDPIYANRLEMLKAALKALGKKAGEVSSLDHAGLVSALVDLYKSDTLLGGEKAPLPAAPAPAVPDPTSDTATTGDGSPADPPAPPASHPALPPANDPVDPPPASEPHPERAPPPTDVRVRPANVAPPEPQDGSALLDSGTAGAPSSTPGTPPNPNALPHWVWYMIFHYTGFRYSPEARGKKHKNGAHGSYFDPALLLELLRGVDIDAKWANPTGKVPASDPDPADVTEALALVNETGIGDFADVPAGRVKDYQAALTSSDNKKVVGALRKLFLSMASKGHIYSDRHTDPQTPLLNGDHFSLGILKARHLVTPFSAGDWKAVTSYTELRNDVTGDGWELPMEKVTAFASSVSSEINRHIYDAWKTRHLATLDLVSNSAVCNQLSEFAEQTRSGTDPPGGIPGNAKRASQKGALMLFTAANVPRIQTGMHVFFPKWGDPSTGEQRYVDADMAVEKWWLNKSSDSTEADVIDAPSLVFLPAQWTFAVLQNGTGDAEERKTLDGYWRVDLATFWSDTSGDNKTGTAFALIEGAGKKISMLKWSHQEIVIGASKEGDRTSVYTYSTAAANITRSLWGLGVRTHQPDVSPFPDRRALLGFLSPTTKDRDDLLLSCYLNENVLLQVG